MPKNDGYGRDQKPTYGVAISPNIDCKAAINDDSIATEFGEKHPIQFY